MILIIVNYAVKIITILIGLVLITGVGLPKMQNTDMVKVMGAVLILWGCYRLIMYRIQLKRYKNEDNSD